MDNAGVRLLAGVEVTQDREARYTLGVEGGREGGREGRRGDSRG